MTMYDIAKPHSGSKDLLPNAVQDYLRHTSLGVSIRQLAREQGCHASTVQRRIRKIEGMRDDVLIDTALSTLSKARPDVASKQKEAKTMNAPLRQKPSEDPTQEAYLREAKRVLRRLCEPNAILAFAADMDKAVVVRETPDGRTVKTCVTDREAAQSLAIRDWLVCVQPGRVARYRITSAGRSALKRMLAEEPDSKDSGPDGNAFGDQHRELATKELPVEGSGTRRRAMRFNVAESPISAMARRRDKDGTMFLTPEMVNAAERLREDFELSQMGPRVAQNWEKFLTGGDRGSFQAEAPTGNNAEAAKLRVMHALSELGPGLSDVAMRVCCFLEGVEAAEKRLGWSARSGKIVLRIALQRLEQHYKAQVGSDMIG